jgi:hypothetical protein
MNGKLVLMSTTTVALRQASRSLHNRSRDTITYECSTTTLQGGVNKLFCIVGNHSRKPPHNEAGKASEMTSSCSRELFKASPS